MKIHTFKACTIIFLIPVLTLSALVLATARVTGPHREVRGDV